MPVAPGTPVSVRAAHTEGRTHRSDSWSTCTARPPWRPRAPHRPGPPRGRRAGLTSWARGRGHRDSRAAAASGRGSAPAPGVVGVDAAKRPSEPPREARPLRRRSPVPLQRPLSRQRPPRRARACPVRHAHAPKSTPGFGRCAVRLPGAGALRGGGG